MWRTLGKEGPTDEKGKRGLIGKQWKEINPAPLRTIAKEIKNWEAMRK
jgi:hypothetical protein